MLHVIADVAGNMDCQIRIQDYEETLVMGSQMTKEDILNDLRSARAEWDELIAQLSEAHMTQTVMAGYWSAKDVIAHLSAVDQWNVNALRAHARGEPPALDEQLMELEERNRSHYERNRQRPLDEILQDSQHIFQQLIELVQAESDEYLTQPQTFENLLEPIVVGKSLHEACADHYRHHMTDVRAWLTHSAKK